MSVSVQKKYYINLIITIAIIFGSKLLPAMGAITEYGSNIVGIFIGVIYGYCTVGVAVPSFMAIIALGFSGFSTVPEIMKMSFGDSTVLYIISILILSSMLEKSGLSEKIVNWMITLKFAKGKPWVITFMFLLAAYVVAIFINSIPSTIICWSLLLNLFPALGFKSGDKWPIVMVFGILFTATLGASIPSFQVSVASNFGLLTVASQGELVMNPLKYMLWSLPCSIVPFIIYFLLIKYIIRPDVSLLKNEDIFKVNNEPLTGEQKIVSAIFIVFIAGLILPAVLPEGNVIKQIFDNLANCGWGLFVIMVALMLTLDKKKLFNFDELFSKGVIWDIVLMIAVIYTLVGAVTDERTGVSELLIGIMSPMQNSMSDIMFFVTATLIYAIIANVTNTVAASFMFIPIMHVLLGDSNSSYIFTSMAVYISSASFLMPSATVNAAMMYNQKEWLPMKYCLGFSLLTIVLIYLDMVVIGLPLGRIIF